MLRLGPTRSSSTRWTAAPNTPSSAATDPKAPRPKRAPPTTVATPIPITLRRAWSGPWKKPAAAYRHIDSDWSLGDSEVLSNNRRTAARQWYREALMPTAYRYLLRGNGMNASSLDCRIEGRAGRPNQPDAAPRRTRGNSTTRSSGRATPPSPGWGSRSSPCSRRGSGAAGSSMPSAAPAAAASNGCRITFEDRQSRPVTSFLIELRNLGVGLLSPSARLRRGHG